MPNLGRKTRRAALALAILAAPGASTRGEDLDQAWAIAQAVNPGLQAQKLRSVAAGFNAAAARSDRLPHVTNTTIGATINPAVDILAGPGASGTGASGAAGGVGSLLTGQNQHGLPLAITSVVVPLYTGGRLKRAVDAADHLTGAQRTEEVRTAMDLRLTVAEAYVGVLRTGRDLEVARSNVERLASFARDVRNRLDQQLATRNDLLAANVSLSNARLTEIRARTAVGEAWATYNRYLCRPLDATVPLVDLTATDEPGDFRELARGAIRCSPDFAALSDDQVRDLTAQALRARPELAGLAEQAQAYAAQAEAAKAGIRPQISYYGSHLLLGSESLVHQNFAANALVMNWTLTDAGGSRRRAAALRNQELSTLRQRANAAQDIALQVRTRWLDLQQAREAIPVAREAYGQSEENNKVVLDRYNQGLSTYTEVLDAENRRIQSFNSYFASNYDAVLATFRLRRTIGGL